MPQGALHLATGGARSGKSRYAERLAHNLAGQHVTYLATLAPGDDELRERVRRHRGRRPPGWTTLELTRDITPASVRAALSEARTATVLLDCVGGLISSLLLERAGAGNGPTDTTIDDALAVADAIVNVARTDGKALIAVTNEVGSGIVPATRLGRLYRDALGLTNQHLAQHADTFTLLTAGLPLTLKGIPTQEPT